MKNKQKLEKKEITVKLLEIPPDDSDGLYVARSIYFDLKHVFKYYTKIENPDQYKKIFVTEDYDNVFPQVIYNFYGTRLETDEEYAQRLKVFEEQEKIMEERHLKRKKTLLANKKKRLEKLQKSIQKMEKSI